MYRWKAWRDCRSRVAIYSAAALAVGFLWGLDFLADEWNHAYWVVEVPKAVLGRWDFRSNLTLGATSTVSIYGCYFALLPALILGATSVGREYSAGAMPFLLTRPCRRRSFVFGDWITGTTAIVILPGLLTLGLVPFLLFVRAAGPGNVFTVLPGLWTVAFAIYGLSHFCTLLAGHTAKGLILSTAIIVTYLWLPTALNEWWHIGSPLAATNWTLRMFDWDWPYLLEFHWVLVFFWLALAGGLLAASMALIRNREV